MTSHLTEAEIRALPAGRELDALVAKIVCGWPHIGMDYPYRLYIENGGVIVEGMARIFPLNGGIIPDPWRPSSDWSAAGPLLETARDGSQCDVQVCITRDGADVSLGDLTEPHIIVPFDPAIPGDLCRAICVARVLAEMESRS